MQIEKSSEWSSIVGQEPIPLKELCSWGKSQLLNLNLQKKKWEETFLEKSGPSSYYNHSGLYVFWWTGSRETLQQGVLNHLIKGKEYKPIHDDERYRLANLTLPELLTSDKGKRYLLQPVIYDFEWIVDDKGERCALYAGKASGVFERIRAHLQWVNTFDAFHKNTSAEVKARVLAKHNGRQQMRAGFEYVFQNEDEAQRKKLLVENVGITVHANHPHLVSRRFYVEDYLIGRLRAAFNVDTER